jgi:hypothetical protein
MVSAAAGGGISTEALLGSAAALAALDLRGRAYAIVEPYRAAFQQDPVLALRFAELAFGAGDGATARAVLGSMRPAAEVDGQLAEWAKQLGWAD